MFFIIEKKVVPSGNTNWFLQARTYFLPSNTKGNQNNHITKPLILFFLLCLVSLTLNAAPPEFGIVQIDEPGAYSAIVTDRDNKVHIAYYAKVAVYGPCHLKYKTNASGAWNTIDIGFISRDDWSCHWEKPSIAVDGNRKPHIVYEVGGSIMYATLNDSGNWTSTQIDINADPDYQRGISPSIALSDNGTPHVSYIEYRYGLTEGIHGYLWHATLNGATWTNKKIFFDNVRPNVNVRDNVRAFSKAPIAVDHTGRIHIIIAYKTADGIKIGYISGSEGDLDFSAVGGTDDYAYPYLRINICLAIDSNNTPYILYNQSSSNSSDKLVLLKLNESHLIRYWEVVPWPNEIGPKQSLALTFGKVDNNAHIAYAVADDKLFYMTNLTGAWETYELPGRPKIKYGTSIAVDKLNRLNISYDDTANNNSKIVFATTVPDLVVTSIVSPQNGGAGRSFQVEDTTTNKGGGRTPVTSTGYFLAKEAEKFPHEEALPKPFTRPKPFVRIPIADRSIGDIGPGESNHGSISITLPKDVPVGLYRILAKADATQKVDEIQEHNNSLTDTHPIGIGPDLVPRVSNPVVNGNLFGTQVSLTVTTLNIGGGDAKGNGPNGEFKTTIRFEPPIFSSMNRTISRPLRPGGKDDWSIRRTLPTPLPGFRVIVTVDVNNDVEENHENNNIVTK
ncbi:MAG: CARDB domain-containing protein [Methylococcaceae bacterium]